MIGFPPHSDHDTPYAVSYFAGFHGDQRREPERAWRDGIEARQRYLEIRVTKVACQPHERKVVRVTLAR